jgi:hypothetical protein
MPALTKSNVRTPLGPKGSERLRARIDRVVSNQAVAATATDVQVIDVSGKVQALSVVVGTLPAAGESLTVDVHKNGVTILTTPAVLDNTMTNKLRALTPVANTSFAVGDRVSVIRTYAAGGGPAPIGPSKVILEIA